MTKSEVVELVAVLSASYPSASLAERTVLVYEQMLEDLDCSAASAAVARLVQTSKWLPTIAEIRGAAYELAAVPRRLAGEAWGDVLSEIRRTGSYGIPRFVDPRTAECVRLMGWRNLCLSENDAADRARFADLYDGLTERAMREGQVSPALALPAPKGNPIRSLIGVVAKPMPALPAGPSEADRSHVRAALKAFEREPDPPPDGPSDDDLAALLGQQAARRSGT